MSFTPALLVVDMQEDFCPPNGAVAVSGGRDIVPAINELLSLPFALKVATRDWHPRDHISFASNHPAPHNKPFTSTAVIANPLNPNECIETRLWPDHCIQGTQGANLIPELAVSQLDRIVSKGQDKRIEMYSAFADPFARPCVVRSDLAQALREAHVTDVYCVGLAADYCVKCTALDACKEGFRTWVVREGAMAVDPAALEAVHGEYATAGVGVVGMEGAEVQRVRDRVDVVDRTQHEDAEARLLD